MSIPTLMNYRDKHLIIKGNKLLIDDSKYMKDPNSSVDKLIELENASRGNFTIYKTSFISGLQMNKESDYNETNNHYVKYLETEIDEII